MADSRLLSILSSVARVVKGQPVGQTGLADGTAFTHDWYRKLMMEGRVFVANAGSGTAPISGAGAYVNTTPDFDMSIPAGALAIPLYLTVQFETYGTSLLNEVVAAIGNGGVIAPTSATAVAAVNMRGDAPYGSRATIVSDWTGATYMTGNVYEFYRDGQQFSISKTSASATVASQDKSKFEWSAFQTGIFPIMFNPAGICRLNVFPCSQAPTSFITLVWAEPDPAMLLG